MGHRGAGLTIPVFSLRTKNSLGSGEILDLIPMLDWVKDAGFRLLQILPINDTSMTETKKDAYPYSILSAFALHPLYINLNSLIPELEEEIIPVAKKLNLPELDYQKTYRAKKEFLKMIYIFRGEKDLKSASFQRFFEANQEHLKPYAAFCILRDHYRTSDFRKWGKHKTYSPLLVEELCETSGVEFFYFVQFHLHQQMREVVAHAKKLGILLKGDFPMGVHPHSVEAWRFHEYFRWDRSMGAPPDFYNAYGQNWGFPPYEWKEIQEEGFFWLKSRLKWMEQYFDIVRLDHVLGYFRLWEIPEDEVRGLMGSFYPSLGYSEEELVQAGLTDMDRLIKPYGDKLPEGLETQRKVLRQVEDESERKALFTKIENRLFFYREGSYHPRVALEETESFRALEEAEKEMVLKLFRFYYQERQEALWEVHGREILNILQKHTKMGIHAEDIGVIPSCVEKVLAELEILNLHVQRMPKSFEKEYETFADFPSTCVCTPSNHDTATLREWWEEDPESTKHYYKTVLKHEDDPPEKLTEKLATEIVQGHLNSKATWAQFLLQDLFAMSDALKFPDPKKERINDPAIPGYEWDWRMHLYVEELLLAQSFTRKIHKMIQEGNR